MRYFRTYPVKDPRIKQTCNRLNVRNIKFFLYELLPWMKTNKDALFVAEAYSEKDIRFLKHLNFTEMKQQA